MHEIGLGKLITTEQNRDAIHIAVAPVIAAERLAPGQHIGFVEGSATHVRAGETRLGIVDPFLTDWVEKDQRFFMLLYPNTITSLRHEWVHPAFDALPTKEQVAKTVADKDAKDELCRYAREQGVDYDRLICIMQYGSRGGDEQVDSVLPGYVWDLYERVTGDKASQSRREEYMGCAC